ncbi:hypothetical protein [Labrenzia sp. CE80]|uniref:hypothetical protein n=1 Tax=Labrenzia sp. CE80 TaxID=1788986 RepID=UPI00129A81D6|nr:hypothetical protein [Labrenzia sp. CE80]
MNTDALLKAQGDFLARHPGGFADPELMKSTKKYKMEEHRKFASENFTPDHFGSPREVIEAMTTLVSRSAMVSMFEKPKFKSATANLSEKEIDEWAESLQQLLHGNQKTGFEGLVDALSRYKLAKWTLATVVPAYYAPQTEVFIKPSTAKLIIVSLGLDLTYKAAPTWEFYQAFRDAILTMREITQDVKAPGNAEFSGFLMMSLGG